MKRTAIYIRVSTDKQALEGDSIPAQREALRKYVQDHNYILVGEYLDDGISGTKEDRAEFQRMMEDVKNGLIDLILVTKMDRIHRSLRNFLNMQDTLDKYHCDWLAIWEPMYDSSTPQGRMIINTMMNLAQFEAEQTGQRIRQVFAYKKEKGEVLNGNPPYGFMIQNKHLVPDPETVENAKQIFQHYAQHGNLYQTRIYADSIGLTRGRNTLKHMLRNPAYKSIVEAEIFETVQRNIPINEKCSAKHTYIFSGLIKCKHCSSRMTGFVRKQSLLYRCPKHYISIPTCNNQRSIAEKTLEKYLLLNLISLLKDYIIKQEELEKPKDNSKRIKALEKKVKRLKDLYLNDLISLEEYKADRQSYLSEIASLQAVPKRDFTAQKQILKMDLKEFYPTLTQEQKRAFWRSIIDHITFDKDRKIEVFFL